MGHRRRKRNADAMPSYKLTYFNGRGRAEGIRMTLAASGVEYEDKRITFEEWGALKPNVPFNGLPMLEADGKQLGQSGAILRFLGKELERRYDEILQGTAARPSGQTGGHSCRQWLLRGSKGILRRHSPVCSLQWLCPHANARRPGTSGNGQIPQTGEHHAKGWVHAKREEISGKSPRNAFLK